MAQMSGSVSGYDLSSISSIVRISKKLVDPDGCDNLVANGVNTQ